MRFENVIKHFYNFLRDPQLTVRRNGIKVKTVLHVTMLFFIVFTMQILLLAPISAALGIENVPHAFEDLLEQFDSWKIILLVVFGAPLIEEFVFRYPLTKPGLILLGAGVLAGGLAFLICENIQGLSQLAQIGIGGLTGFGCILFLILRYLRSGRWPGLIHNHYGSIFYVVAVVFAFVHIFNFTLAETQWWYTPLLVLPQFILGLLLGYVRIQYSIWMSVFVHALNNLLPTVFLFLI